MFSLIAIANASDGCSGLLEHQLRVIQAVQKYRFASVIEYDIRVRQVVVKDHKRSIGETDTELYASCFIGQALNICFKCKRPGHSAASCTTRTSNQASLFRPSSTNFSISDKQYN